MCNSCNQAILLQMECKCQQQQNISDNNQGQYVDLQSIYKKFTQTLQNQLHALQEQNNKEIERLNAQIFQLKNMIHRLQGRNKRDSQAEKELRRQYNYLLQKYNQLNNKPSNHQVQIVEKIKQIKITSQSPALLQQISRIKKKNEDLNIQLHKIKMGRDLALVQNQNLKDEIHQLNEKWKLSKLQLQELKNDLKDKDSMTEKLLNQNQYLKNNKEIIKQTKHLFPEFKPAEILRNQPKFQTIYVQKPIQKIKLIQIERRVKQFVQPQRAVVNRVICCEPSPCKCKCKRECSCESDDQQKSSIKFQSKFRDLKETVGQLQRNVQDYKSQRQKLVSVIGEKNSQLNRLQTKFQLYGGSSYNRQSGPSQVNVTVTKLGHNQEPSNQRVSNIVNQRQTRIKR